MLFKLCDFGQILVVLKIQASLRGTNCITVKYKFHKTLLTVFREGDDLEDLAETREYLQQKWKLVKFLVNSTRNRELTVHKINSKTIDM